MTASFIDENYVNGNSKNVDQKKQQILEEMTRQFDRLTRYLKSEEEARKLVIRQILARPSN